MGGITAGNVTSGGTLTLQAAGPIALTKLVSTGGDVDMISTASTITGGTVVAHGSDNFAAYGNNIGPSVTSQTGSITLSSQVGIVDWGLSNAATTFTATSGMGGIDVGTVTSGGTLTLQASGPIALTKLVSTGGDVDMISTASTITGGTVVAHGSDNFAAYGNNIGPSVTSQTGSITLSSQVGIVDWGLSNAATTFTATSGMGGIDVGTVTSGGALTLQSQGNVDFGSLTSGSTVDATSSGGSVMGQPGGSIAASGPIDVSAQSVSVGQTSSSEPIRVSSTGASGQAGSSATLQESEGGTVYTLDVDILTRVGDYTLTSHIDDVEVDVWEFPVMEYERHLSRARRVATGQTGSAPKVNLQGSFEPDVFTIVFKRKN